MKYAKVDETIRDLKTHFNSIEHNGVGWATGEEKVLIYEFVEPYAVKFTAEGEQTIYITHRNGTLDNLTVRLQFSNDGVNWNEVVVTESGITGWVSGITNFGNGVPLYVRGVNRYGFVSMKHIHDTTYYFTFSFANQDVPVRISGNIMALINYQDENLTSLYVGTNNSGNGATFYKFFMNQTCIVDISKLKFPATKLASYSYRQMFSGCENLEYGPSELPVSTAYTYSCANMFSGCRSLKNAPSILPTVSMGTYAFNGMYNNCQSLTSVPSLPSTSLASNCYRYMFAGCTGITEAQNILPAQTLATSCYTNMFSNCISLETAPELPAVTLATSAYTNMFSGCSNLNYVKAMFTTTPSSAYTNNWLDGVSESGTFVKNSAAEWDVTGPNGIPNGWTVETASS